MVGMAGISTQGQSSSDSENVAFVVGDQREDKYSIQYRSASEPCTLGSAYATGAASKLEQFCVYIRISVYHKLCQWQSSPILTSE